MWGCFQTQIWILPCGSLILIPSLLPSTTWLCTDSAQSLWASAFSSAMQPVLANGIWPKGLALHPIFMSQRYHNILIQIIAENNTHTHTHILSELWRTDSGSIHPFMGQGVWSSSLPPCASDQQSLTILGCANKSPLSAFTIMIVSLGICVRVSFFLWGHQTLD